GSFGALPTPCRCSYRPSSPLGVFAEKGLTRRAANEEHDDLPSRRRGFADVPCAESLLRQTQPKPRAIAPSIAAAKAMYSVRAQTLADAMASFRWLNLSLSSALNA